MGKGPCYLVSGHDPFWGGTQEIDARIYRCHGNGRGRILFIPASGAEEHQRQYAEKFAPYASSLGLEMSALLLPEVALGELPLQPRPGIMPVVRRFSDGKALNRAELAETFKTADYIYLGGGRPEHLLYSFLDLRLMEFLSRASERGAPLIGYSAGAYLLADRWWELSGTPILFRKGREVAIPDQEGHAMLGYQKVNFAEIYRDNPLAQMMARYVFGEPFKIEDYEPFGYLQLFYRVHAGSGFLKNLFCRVHFELRHEHLSEFYLIKENFKGYCVVKLEDPEMAAVRDGQIFDHEDQPVASVFTGQPIHLDGFPGLGPTRELVNDLPEAVAGRIHDLAPAKRFAMNDLAVRYFPASVKGDRRTHHLLLNEAGAYLSPKETDQALEMLLRTDALRVIYPHGFPLHF